ncbi:unnamed protein product [Ciceribacter sp. T2.26MG-112.2]|uniref:hypothetical protein n=1 Tax=Ciceribacter sp. T2.26MG-112.2 TaxID=3137154 RepID=UPI000E1A1AEF|nr:hypothetical protein [Ciceribacter naphthalenivorans]SSC70024.1 unnamed protein product [Ciceribacter naphthalenivorans]SSX47360.1 unnamed protein product [Ciceribacter naphthalenivorans]
MWCELWLGVFERKGTPKEPSETASHSDQSGQIILFGLGRFGSAELLCGGRGEERTEIPEIETEGRIVA